MKTITCILLSSTIPTSAPWGLLPGGKNIIRPVQLETLLSWSPGLRVVLHNQRSRIFAQTFKLEVLTYFWLSKLICIFAFSNIITFRQNNHDEEKCWNVSSWRETQETYWGENPRRETRRKGNSSDLSFNLNVLPHISLFFQSQKKDDSTETTTTSKRSKHAGVELDEEKDASFISNVNIIAFFQVYTLTILYPHNTGRRGKTTHKKKKVTFDFDQVRWTNRDRQFPGSNA